MPSRYVLAAFTFAAAGGFAGGWLSARQIARGDRAASRARFASCIVGAALSLVTAAIPAAHTPAWAAAGISLSFFAVSAMSVNVYSLPLDTFGRRHAAFSIAALVASYGAMQVVVSPVIGRMIDAHRWAPIIWAADAHARARLRRPVDREAARVKQRLKRWFFRLLGKDPEAVVVSFVTGDAALVRAAWSDEVRALVPDRRHFVATPENWPELRRELRAYRIGLAPRHAHARSRTRSAAPRIASRRARSWPTTRALNAIICGSIWRRSFSGAACRSIASICAPGGGHCPNASDRWFPRVIASSKAALLARAAPHGRSRRRTFRTRWRTAAPCASTICCANSRANSMSSCSPSPTRSPIEAAPVLEFCARVVLVEKPRYREPRWSTLSAA